MKEKKALRIIYFIYASMPFLNQLWRLGKGKEVYLPLIDEYYPADWYIHMIMKSLIMGTVVFSLYMGTYIKNVWKIRMIAKLFMVSSVFNAVLFSLYQYKRDVALEIIIVLVFFVAAMFIIQKRQEGEVDQ